MAKRTMSSEPRVLVSPSLNKKQSTLSRFFTPKNDVSRPPKRTSDCVAEDAPTAETKWAKTTKDLNTLTINKLKRFKNNSYTENKEILIINDEKQSKLNTGNEKEIQKSTPTSIKVNSLENLKPNQENLETKSCEKNFRKSVNLTPLEKQFVEIKSRHPNAVLFVECGYKYRFFGDDAKIAANVLNIMCHQDHNFMTASIPVYRLHIHVKRLVDAAYKVGVVKQTETAAIKAAGENKNAPFTRELTALYTQSTLVGEEFEDDKITEGLSRTNSSYLMCVIESNSLTTEKNELPGNADISLAILAVQPVSGNILYDVFNDAGSRQELETRLEHINPVDLLIPNSLSAPSKRCIHDWKNHCSASKVRTEEVPSARISTFKEALVILESFYDIKLDSDDSESQENSQAEPNVNPEKRCMIPSDLRNYPESLVICLSVVLEYLKEFKLESVLKVTSNFTTFFQTENNMKLPGSTIRNLEIFSNQTDNKVKGSLFSVLDRTSTAFGKRKLNSWISKPLTNLREIEQRQQVVAEIVEKKPACLEKVKRLLKQLPDLEKGLCVIYHRKCSTAQFYNILVFLSKVHTEIASIKDVVSRELNSLLLNDIATKVSTNLSEINVYLDAIDEKAAKSCNKTNLFKDETEFTEIKKWREKILETQEQIQGHRKVIKKILSKPSVDYVTVSGNEFLVEVSMSKTKLVPHDWIKISSTKTLSRFRTPFVEECFKKLSQYREHLSKACQEAWLKFLSSFGSNYTKYCEAVRQLATLDCLMSLAEVAEQQGYTRPRLCDKTGHIHIRQGKHPVVDVLLNGQGQYVANDTTLESNSERCMIITGPNMGGKSSYVRQVALICIMAQIGSFVPADEAELGIIDAVYTRMGGNDDIYKGRSTFMNELQETSDVLKHATPRSLIILDELGRGTSTHDGTAIAYATLSYVITNITSLTLFITHYPSLANLQQSFPNQVSNYHMAFIAEGQDPRADDNTEEHSDLPTVTFLYRLVKGVAENSYGLNVARLAEIPSEILKNAALKSHELQNIIKRRRNERGTLSTIWNCSSNEIRENIQQLSTKKIMY